MAPIRTDQCEKWPYSKKEYAMRVLWFLVHKTIWRLSWKRINILRATQLNLFGADVSTNTQFSGSVQISFPWLMKCGSHTAVSDRVNIYNLGGIEIGQHVVISHDVDICGGTHDYTKRNYPLIRKPVVIHDGVWICAGAFIGPGVTIGEGAVVGARAVVIRDVEPWTVVAGNPAKFIKKRVIVDE